VQRRSSFFREKETGQRGEVGDRGSLGFSKPRGGRMRCLTTEHIHDRNVLKRREPNAWDIKKGRDANCGLTGRVPGERKGFPVKTKPN